MLEQVCDEGLHGFCGEPLRGLDLEPGGCELTALVGQFSRSDMMGFWGGVASFGGGFLGGFWSGWFSEFFEIYNIYFKQDILMTFFYVLI